MNAGKAGHFVKKWLAHPTKKLKLHHFSLNFPGKNKNCFCPILGDLCLELLKNCLNSQQKILISTRVWIFNDIKK